MQLLCKLFGHTFRAGTLDVETGQVWGSCSRCPYEGPMTVNIHDVNRHAAL